MRKNRKYFEIYPVQKPAEVFSMPSPRMIKTLKKCYRFELDYPGKPYGPADFNESFIGLYKRGLIDVRLNDVKSKSGSWYITIKGLQFLLTVPHTFKATAHNQLLDNINNLKTNLSMLRNSIHSLKVTSGRIPEDNIAG